MISLVINHGQGCISSTIHHCPSIWNFKNILAGHWLPCLCTAAMLAQTNAGAISTLRLCEEEAAASGCLGTRAGAVAIGCMGCSKTCAKDGVDGCREVVIDCVAHLQSENVFYSTHFILCPHTMISPITCCQCLGIQMITKFHVLRHIQALLAVHGGDRPLCQPPHHRALILGNGCLHTP